jgi:hypothetical protein
MLLHNFTYDDFMDECFIFNYKGVQALDPSKFIYIKNLCQIKLKKSPPWCYNGYRKFKYYKSKHKLAKRN